MDDALTIAVCAACLAFIAAMIAVFCFLKLRGASAKIGEYELRLDDLENQPGSGADKKVLEEVAARAEDALRRVAWLESRQPRQPKSVPEIAFASAEILQEAAPVKLSMSERRYRIVTLDQRGQSIENIARTLGMLPGEVELILNLSRTV